MITDGRRPGPAGKAGGKLFTAAVVLIFLAGLAILLYPTGSNLWNRMHQSRAISQYCEIVDDMKDEDQEKMFRTAENYNKILADNPARFHPTEEESEEYAGTLDITGTGIMGYLSIPKIDCELAIYHGTDEGVLQTGAGHLTGSSLPVGGEGTHCVLSGHTGLPSAKLFTGLDQLEIGDRFTITVLSRTLTYEVDQILVVDPEDASALKIEEGRDLCTLITCTPYGINSHRLLVRGSRVEEPKEQTKVTDSLIGWTIARFSIWNLMLVAMGGLVVIGQKFRRRKRMIKRMIGVGMLLLTLLCSVSAVPAMAAGKTGIMERKLGANYSKQRTAGQTSVTDLILQTDAIGTTCSLTTDSRIYRASSDEKGTIRFYDIPAGTYTISGTTVTVDGEKHTPATFTLELPYFDEEQQEYVSKLEITWKCDNPPESTTEPEKPTKKITPPSTLPRTGMMLAVIPILAGAGVICLILGVRKSRQDEMKNEGE